MAWTDGASLSADAKVNGPQATHRVLGDSDRTESEVRNVATGTRYMTKLANGQTYEVPVGNDAPDNDANFHWWRPWNYDAVTLKEARSAQPSKAGNVAIPDTTDRSGNLAASRDVVSVSGARVHYYTIQYKRFTEGGDAYIRATVVNPAARRWTLTRSTRDNGF